MSSSISYRALGVVAAIAGVCVLFLSTALVQYAAVQAANVTGFQNTLSDTAPSAAANHTLSFVTPNGVGAGEYIEITFPGDFTLGMIGANDIDLAVAGVDETITTDWLVTTTTSAVRLTSAGAGGTIAPGASTTIEIGTHATSDGVGNTQITNPATTGSYPITADVGSSDTGEARVMIVQSVTVAATVDTSFTFSVSGLAVGAAVNGDVTTGSSSPTSLQFGRLVSGVATTTGHELSVTTNAADGYTVSVQTSGPLQAANGADIDGFIDGSDTNTPTTWSVPGAVLGDENTYGHWGLTSDDATTTRAAEFSTGEYIAASTSPRVIMSHTGPANGGVTGVGRTRVGYTAEVSALQEAASDYTTTITYIATPVY